MPYAPHRSGSNLDYPFKRSHTNFDPHHPSHHKRQRECAFRGDSARGEEVGTPRTHSSPHSHSRRRATVHC
jgi:hypothetical protein